MNHSELTERPVAKTRGSVLTFLKKLQLRISSSPASYLAFCFLVPAILMYLVYLAMEIHPFGNGTVLVLDLNGQYVYFHEALRGAIYGDNSFLYTFFRGLGGEFMGIYTYYLASPLSYLVALFPQSAIQEALLTIILLKVGLCGWSFGFYLHKHSEKPNKLITVAFSVMYALSAYAVVYQNNIMWMDALVWLPILTYAIEQLVLNRRYKLFVISLALTIMSNYYIGYMVCLYVVLYSLYYYFSHTPESINPRKERLHVLRAGLRVILFSLLAALISAFILIAAYYALTLGKNGFSNPNWTLNAKFDLLDFFTKFLPGTYDTVRPEGLPFVYCGLLTLLLIPVYFMSRAIRSREKIASALLIVFFVLCFVASPMDLIWHGFQSPNWLNYRYSFLLCFILLVLAYKGMGNLKRVGGKFLFCLSALLIFFVAVCGKLDFETYLVTNEALLPLETVWLTILVTLALLSVLCLMLHQEHPKKREALAAVLVAIVCIEVYCSSLTCVVQFNDDVSYASYSSYHNYLEDLRPITEEVQSKDQGFYRMEKLVHRKYNDNMALSMRGLSGSTSTLNSETIRFLNRMGYTARAHLSLYQGGNPVNDSLLGVKYLIDVSSSEQLSHTYEKQFSDEKYTAYYNPYALSLAYGVNSATKEFDFSYYSTFFDRLNAMAGTMAGNYGSTKIFRPVDDFEKTLSGGCGAQSTDFQIIYESTLEGGNAEITYRFIAPKSAEYCFYTPSPAPVETELSVNGVELGRYLGSDTNHMVWLGWFEENETVEVTISLLEDSLRLYSYYDYFWYIDQDAFEETFGILKNGPQWQIDGEASTDDHLLGSIVTEMPNQTIFTSIPYDEGWKIYLDGQEIEYEKIMDALISFDIPQTGTHTLEMKYDPDCYSLGINLSLIGLAVFLMICLVDWTLFRRYRKSHPDKTAIHPDLWLLEDFDENHEQFLALSEEEKHAKLTVKEFLALFKPKKEFPEEKDAEEDSEITEEQENNSTNQNEGEL